MRYDAFSPGGFLLGLRVRRGTKPLPQKAPGEQRSEQRHLACVARRSAGHRPGPRLAQAAQRGRWTLTKRGPSPRPRQNSSVARGTPRYADASALVSGRWCGASASDAMPSAARRSPRVGAGRFGPRGAGVRLTAGACLTAGVAGRATRDVDGTARAARVLRGMMDTPGPADAPVRRWPSCRVRSRAVCP